MVKVAQTSAASRLCILHDQKMHVHLILSTYYEYIIACGMMAIGKSVVEKLFTFQKLDFKNRHFSANYLKPQIKAKNGFCEWKKCSSCNWPVLWIVCCLHKGKTSYLSPPESILYQYYKHWHTLSQSLILIYFIITIKYWHTLSVL